MCLFNPKNTGVGCHFLLQEIFLTQGSNSVSCIGRWVLHHWATREAPWIEWQIFHWIWIFLLIGMILEVNSLEKEMAIHSWIGWHPIIPWTEEPGGLQSVGSQRVRQDWMTCTFRGELYLTMDTREFLVYCRVKVYRILDLGGTFKILSPNLLLAESLNWVYLVDDLIEVDLRVWLVEYSKQIVATQGDRSPYCSAVIS